MQALVVFLLILAILLVIFTLQNSIGITINVFFWEIANAPLVLVLLTCIILGYILSSVYYLPKILKLRKENNKLKKIKSEFVDEKNIIKPDDKDHVSELIDDNPEGLQLDDDINDDSFFKD